MIVILNVSELLREQREKKREEKRDGAFLAPPAYLIWYTALMPQACRLCGAAMLPNL